nr:uncharacterized protein LOC115266995 [Aedes albopictus]
MFTGAYPGKSKRPEKKSKAEKACFNCGKQGHFAAKCPERVKSKPKGLCSIFAIGDVKNDAWYFDSGATCHMARVNQGFTDEKILEHNVGTANNGSMKAVARGTVGLRSEDGLINVHDVLKIPDLATNLLSISAQF